MASFTRVFSLTKNCDQYVTSESPVLPGVPYTLVEVIPDETGTDIARINGTYVFGEGTDQYIQYTLNNPELGTIMTGAGANLLEKTLNVINNFSSSDVENILEAQPATGTSQTERLLSVFQTGLASVLFFYNLISRDLSEEGDPFEPFEVSIPPDDQGDLRLNQNVYQYLNYSSKVLTAINVCNLGRSWLSQISDFWNVWGLSFPTGKEQNLNLAVFKAVSGFASYITVRINTATEKVEDFENTHIQYMNNIQQTRDASLALLSDQKKSLDTRFTQALLVLLTTAAPILEAIKANGANVLAKIEETKNSVKDNVTEQFNSTVSEHKNHCSQIMSDIIGHQTRAETLIDRKGKDMIERIHNESIRFEANIAELDSNCKHGLKQIKNTTEHGVEEIKKLKKTTTENLHKVTGNQLTMIEQLCTDNHEKIKMSCEEASISLTQITSKFQEETDSIKNKALVSIENFSKDINERVNQRITEAKENAIKEISIINEESCSALHTAKDDVLDSVYIGHHDISKFVDELGADLIDAITAEIGEQVKTNVDPLIDRIKNEINEQVKTGVSEHINSIAEGEVKKLVDASTEQIESEIGDKIKSAYQELNSIKDEIEKMTSIVNKKYSRIKVFSDSLNLILNRLTVLEDTEVNIRLAALEKKTQKIDDLMTKLVDVINRK